MNNDAIIVASVLNLLAERDKYGRLIEAFPANMYENAYVIFDDSDSVLKRRIDGVLQAMHRRRLIDLDYDIEIGKTTPISFRLRPEGLELYRRLCIE